MRCTHQRAERRAAVEGVEQITERARQNPLDANDFVAARNQVPQRRHHRQAGADVRLEQEVPLAPREVLEQRRVAPPRQRIRPLVRRDDVKVGVDESGVGVDDRRPDGTVDERRVRELQLRQGARERFGVHPQR